MARCCLLLVLAIVGGGLAAAGAHALSGPPGATGPQDEWAAVREHVTGEMARLQVPGASLAVVRDGDVVFAEGFGVADARGRAVEADTPFAIASVSKWITAIAVLQLVDAGMVDLDAPVSRYLTEFRDRAGDVTILDLLTHTSGWSTADGLRNWADAGDGADALRRNARRIARTAHAADPRGYEYSNANYDVLGEVVARVSGSSYEAHVRRAIFEPLGMDRSFASWDAARAAGMAEGHYRFFGQPTEHRVPFVAGSLPSAFLASSADDLARLAIVMLEDGHFGGVQLLSPATTSLMERPLVRRGSSRVAQAMGLRVEAAPRGPMTDGPGRVEVMLRRSGDLVTYASDVVLLPADRVGVVVLMNSNDALAPARYHRIALDVANLVTGRAAPAPSAPNPLANLGRPLLLFVLVLQIAIATHPRHGRRTVARAHDWLPTILGGVTLAAAVLAIAVTPSVPPLAAIRLAPDAALVVAIVTILGIPAVEPRGLRRRTRILEDDAPAPAPVRHHGRRPADDDRPERTHPAVEPAAEQGLRLHGG